MTDFSQLQQQFAQVLISSISSSTPAARDLQASSGNGLDSLLNALIDSFPSYANPAWSSAHRGALANLAEANMPNNGISSQPDDSGPWYAPYNTSYSYNGPYSGYRNAFFNNVSQSAVATQIVAQTQAINSGLNAGWWGNYGVTMLTQAISQTISVGIDGNKLSGDLTNNFNAFKPALAASFLSVFSCGYPATTNALQAISGGGQQTAAYQLLDTAIKNGQFTANINQSLSMGGDNAIAATWFLFNVWITLKALGCPNIDQAISSYQSAGLSVPPEVGPQNWWNGTYSGWFVPLGGGDVVNDARNTITAAMPESEMTVYPSGEGPTMPVTDNTTAGNGYSYSFCNWGSLNWYNPQSSSCFGAGTLVLMADGSSKAIENVKIGELVYTQLGPRKVVLCESPKRQGRPLYAINGLQMSVTAAHPFLCAEGDAKYCALEPWSLLDGIPTFSSNGVTTLKPGLRLQAWANNALTTLAVENIAVQTANKKQSADPELVYDLILENWEKDHPTYFVGGPKQFLAVESETVDPLHEPSTSVAIITALNLVVDASREHLHNPVVQIPAILRNIDLGKTAQQARKLSKLYLAGKTFERPAIPNQHFYLQKEEWDANAAMLEHYLASYFGRWLRTELHAGWRHQTNDNNGDVWLLDIHDIEMVNAAVPGKQKLKVSIDVSDAAFQRRPKDIEYTTDLPAKPSWCLRLDETMELGRAPLRERFALQGKVSDECGLIGQFHLHSAVRNPQNKFSDVFLYNAAGDVVGRMALSLRTTHLLQHNTEQVNRKQWSRRNSHAYAYALGQQLGLQIQAALATNSHHI